MKKLFFASIVFLAISLVFTSCKKDDDTLPGGGVTDDLTGTFKVFKDGALLTEGTVSFVGLVQDNEGNWTNNVSMSSENSSVIIFQFPVGVGSETTMDANGDPGVGITSGDIYISNGGTMKRESATRVSFDGTFVDASLTGNYNMTGYIEAEALKKVN